VVRLFGGGGGGLIGIAAVMMAAACDTHGTHADPATSSGGADGTSVVGSDGAGESATGGTGELGTGGASEVGTGGTGENGAGGAGTGGGAGGSAGHGSGGAGASTGHSSGDAGASTGHGSGGAVGAMGTGGAAATGGANGDGGMGFLRQQPLAEWPINEAASGQTPSTLHDAQPSPVNLNITFVGATPSYAEDATGRSLLFPAGNIKTSGAFSPQLDTGNKIYDAVNGAAKATLEVVADVDWRNNAAYIFQIFGVSQEDGENDGFMLWRWRYGTNDDHLEASFTSPVGYPNGYYKRSADMSKVSAGVHTFHVVLDTTAPVAADRLRIFLDGVRMANTTPNEGGHDIPLNTVINLPRPGQSNGPITGRNHYQQMALGGYTNYYAGTGGFRGKIYYAAIHKDALDAAEIAGAGARILNRP